MEEVCIIVRVQASLVCEGVSVTSSSDSLRIDVSCHVEHHYPRARVQVVQVV